MKRLTLTLAIVSWFVGFGVMGHYFPLSGLNIWVFGSIGIWFVYELHKSAKKSRRDEIRAATQRGMYAAGMPADHTLCGWGDCPLSQPHAHPRMAQLHYSSYEAWQLNGAPPT